MAEDEDWKVRARYEELVKLPRYELVARILEKEHPSMNSSRVRFVCSRAYESQKSSLTDAAAESGADGQQQSKKQSKKQQKKEKAKRKRASNTDLDWDSYEYGYVAFRIAYLGANYAGVALQHHVDNTVDEALLSALEKTRLIRDRNDCDYACCGRTDKGVSALGQVVSLKVRTSRRPVFRRKKQRSTTAEEEDENSGAEEVKMRDDDDDDGAEEGNSIDGRPQVDEEGIRVPDIDYCRILNNVLPSDIAVTGWASVPKSFSPRHDCSFRVYRYFFYADGMDLERMNRAARLIEGPHDFRNFCQMDVPAVSNFRRAIFSIHAQPCGLRIPTQMPGKDASALTMTCRPLVEDENDPDLLKSKELAKEYGMDGLAWSRLLLYIQRGRLSRSYQTYLAQNPDNPEGLDLRSMNPNQLCEVVLVGNAFLLHQIRFIVSVMFMCGRGQEDPEEIIPWLFDVENNPRRPAYKMAPALPLLLSDCVFPQLRWNWTERAHVQENVFNRFFQKYREQRMSAHISDVFASTAIAPLVHYYENQAQDKGLPSAPAVEQRVQDWQLDSETHHCCSRQRRLRHGATSSGGEGEGDSCDCDCCLECGANLLSGCECVKARVLDRVAVKQLGDRAPGSQNFYRPRSSQRKDSSSASSASSGPLSNDACIADRQPGRTEAKDNAGGKGSSAPMMVTSEKPLPKKAGGSKRKYRPLMKLNQLPSFEEMVEKLPPKHRVQMQQTMEATELNRVRQLGRFTALRNLIQLMHQRKGFLPEHLVPHE